jgi:hypothetical protein
MVSFTPWPLYLQGKRPWYPLDRRLGGPHNPSGQHEEEKILDCTRTRGSQDSIVGIATGYELDDRGAGVQVPVGSRIFSSPHHPDWVWGPPNLLHSGYPGVKQPGREVNHLPPASAEVKKMCICTSTPPIHPRGTTLPFFIGTRTPTPRSFSP